jgi:O-antigen/teichoic acid export membrane protein
MPERSGSTLKQRLLRDVIRYGTGDVLTRGLVLLALPLYTRLFSPSEYGVLTLILTLMALLTSILALGSDSAYALHYYDTQTDEERRVLTSTVVGGVAVFALGVCLVLLPGCRYFAAVLLGSSERWTLIVLALLVAPVFVTNRILGQVLRSQFRSGALATMNVGTSVLSVSIGLLAAVHMGMGVNGIVLGTLLGEAISLPARLFLIRDHLALAFSRTLVSRLLPIGLPLIPTAIAYWVFLTSDRVMLSKLSTFEQVGLYGVANATVGPLLLAGGIISQAWSPHALQMYTERPGEASVMFGRFLTYVLAFMGFLCVLFSAFASELVHLFTSPSFYPAAGAVPPLALALVAYATTFVTAIAISLKKRTRYLAIYSAYTAALNVILCALLIPRFGQLGAAWATTTAYVAVTLMYLWRSQRLWPVAYETHRSLVLVALIAGFTALVSNLPDGSVATMVPIKIAFCLLFVGAAFFCRALDGRDVGLLRSMFGARSRSAEAPIE